MPCSDCWGGLSWPYDPGPGLRTRSVPAALVPELSGQPARTHPDRPAHLLRADAALRPVPDG